MQLRHEISRFPVRAALTLALAAVFSQPLFAVKLVGTDINGGHLVYLVPSKPAITMFTTGAKPDGVVVGPYQQIIYVLSTTGQVHSFDPYAITDTTLATGLTTPVDLVVEPGCKSILVSDIGVNKIFRIVLASHVVTTLYNGPDKIEGITYDSVGNLFANDDQLNAVVQIDPTTGLILNQTSAGSPLTALNDLTYDSFTKALFATSSTGQVLYQVTTDLATVTTLTFTGGPLLAGIVSDGGGNLYVVGGDGTTSKLYRYTISSGTLTIVNTVPGLEDIAPLPPGPCIKAGGGGEEACDGI